MSDTTRRAYQLGGFTVTVLTVVAVLIAVLSGSPATPLRPGKPVPGASGVGRLLAGIPQSGITLGSQRAPITLVEFADLQCPHCANFATRALPTIVSRFVRPGHLRLVFRNLDSLGSGSVRAAQMAAALGNQDHLWQFVELAYRNQGDENSG